LLAWFDSVYASNGLQLVVGQGEETIDGSWPELASAHSVDFAPGVDDRRRLLVKAVLGHGVEGVAEM
jgi:hypothetical protein